MGMVKIGSPILFIGSSSCDHLVRLSGPEVPPIGFSAGIDPWSGPYGATIETWTDVSHPPGGIGISYPMSDPINPRPNQSWLVGSQIPSGWYTVIRKRSSS